MREHRRGDRFLPDVVDKIILGLMVKKEVEDSRTGTECPNWVLVEEDDSSTFPHEIGGWMRLKS